MITLPGAGKHFMLGVTLCAVLFAAACGAPKEQAAKPGAAAPAGAPAAGEVDPSTVKDAFDTDETTGVAGVKTKEEQEAARQAYSPFAGKTYPRLALFGDTHNHTAAAYEARRPFEFKGTIHTVKVSKTGK